MYFAIRIFEFKLKLLIYEINFQITHSYSALHR